MNKGTELEKVKKRSPGQLKDHQWLVLTESTQEGRRPYIHSCGEIVLGAMIAHPIWDGPFPESGSGRCHYELWPYCPECEEKPGFHGSPNDLRKFLWPGLVADDACIRRDHP